MPREPHRTRELSDGTRVVEKFTGLTPKDTTDDRKWTPVVELLPGEVYSGFVRPAADIACAPHPRSDGVLLEIAGVRFGIPTDQVEAALEELQAIVAAKKAQRGG